MADDQDTKRTEQERLKGGMGQQGGAEQGGLSNNDQVGGGLGQNQTGYGGQNPEEAAPAPSGDAETTAHNAERQASQGVGTRSDNLGPSPTGSQPRSAATGGPDLSKGLGDSNRGGGSF